MSLCTFFAANIQLYPLSLPLLLSKLVQLIDCALAEEIIERRNPLVDLVQNHF